MQPQEILTTLALNDETVTMIVGVSVVGGVIVICTLAGAIRRIITTRERETTTRELAAYIAEGSITPDVAERLINARAKADLRDELSRKAAEGWISAKTVEKLMGEEPARAHTAH
jgi:hypothetical protein